MTTLTKDAIKKSFMKLLNQKPINKITVKEIVEDCGINRNSFYYHFEDIPSLMEEIFNDQVDAFVNRDNVSDNIYDNIMDAIEFSLENKTAMIHIFDSPNHRLFDHYINRVAHRTVTEFFYKLTADAERIDEDDREALILYYTSLLIGFVFEWMSAGMKYDPALKVKRICRLFEGTTELAVKRCSRSRDKV